MSRALTGYYKRIIQRQIRSGRFTTEDEVVRHSLRVLDALDRTSGPAGASFANPRELENLLLQGLDSGQPKPMIPARNRKIYSVVKAR